MIGEGTYLQERVSKQQHLEALSSNSQQPIKRVQQNRKSIDVRCAALLRPHDLSERTTKGLDGKGNGEEAVSCPLSFSDAGQLLNRLLLLLGGVSSSSKHSRCGSRTEPCATLNEACTALRTRLVPIPMLAWKVERKG